MTGVQKEEVVAQVKASNGRSNRFSGSGGKFTKEIQSLT